MIMKKFKKYITALAALGFAASCATEQEMPGVPTPATPDGDGKVEVSLRIEMPEMPEVLNTRANYRVESGTIYHGHLLVMKLNENKEWVLDYYEQIFRADNPNNTGPGIYAAHLEPTNEPLKLIFLANQDNNFDSYMVDKEGSTESALRTGYTKQSRDAELPYFTHGGTTGNYSALSMWGESELPYLQEHSSTIVDMPLVPSMARVDVTKNLVFDSDPFTVTSFQLFNTTNNVQIMPNPDAIDDTEGSLNITKPSLPNVITYYDGYKLYVTDDGVNLIADHPLYVSESAVASLGSATAPCLIVGGKYNGSETETFYRIDFGSGATYGQVLRNHNYIFNIRSVMGPGATTAATAAAAKANSMIVDASWGQSADKIYFLDGTNNSVVISNRSVTLTAAAGSSPAAAPSITTAYDFKWRLESSTVWNDGAASAEDANVSVQATLSGTTLTFAITTKQANTTGEPIMGKIIFSVKGLESSIEWTQLSE